MSESLRLPDWRSLEFYQDQRAHWARLVASGRFPRVTMLTGRRGIGKRMLAAQMVAMYFCDDHTGCGYCGACQDVLAGTHPEVLWIESEEGKLKMESALALQEHLALRPQAGMPVRVVVLARAEELLASAANRLLKILEEPPEGARILLTSDSPKALLPTILSRTVRFHVPPAPMDDSIAYLREHCPDVSDEQIRQALRRAGMVTSIAKAHLLQEQDDLFEEVFSMPPGEAALWAARKKDLRLDELVAQWEMRLAERYRSGETGDDWGQMRKQRDFLRQVRRMVAGGRIPLNKQLFVERMRYKQGFQ